MIRRSAEVVWNGTLVEGKGLISAGSKAFQLPYSIRTRMEQGVVGSNPEELLGAAHAACFTMALAAMLSGAGLTPTRLQTKATVTLEGSGVEYTIARIDLVLEGQVPGLDAAAFQKHAETAKASCPVSRALAGVASITLKATLL
jgi:osmotically inducible protein OsmC